MSEHIQKTIDELVVKLAEQESGVRRYKRMINELCDIAGKEKLYANVDESKSASSVNLRGDEYYGKAQATAVREYLDWRKNMGRGPGTIDEIYDALAAGGYQFDTKLGKRGMSIAIAKNTQTFHKLPNGKIGLMDWYPDVKESKSRKNLVDVSQSGGGDESGSEMPNAN